MQTSEEVESKTSGDNNEAVHAAVDAYRLGAELSVTTAIIHISPIANMSGVNACMQIFVIDQISSPHTNALAV